MFRPVVVVMVLPEAYALCKLTPKALGSQVAKMLLAFRQTAVNPWVALKVSTSSVEVNDPAPVTPRVPPNVVAPDPTANVLEPVTLVFPFKLTAPVPVENVPDPVCETLPEVETPVNPDSTPAAVKLAVGEVMKFVNPVPKVMPLKVLLVCDVTFPKLSPVNVLAPLPLAVPAKLTAIPFTAVVPEDAVSVAFTVVAVPVLLAKFCVIVPVPAVKVKFWLAATVVEPLIETLPVPVENVPLPVCE